MSWLTQFFASSIGKKLIMALTGLFLISFLLVHCAGNLTLFAGDEGHTFNLYAHFMSSNPVIKVVAYGLYAMILVHTVRGILFYVENRSARGGVGYNVANGKSASWYSKQMAVLGSIIFIFIAVHMSHFWWSVQMGTVPEVEYDGHKVENLYHEVATAFQIPWVAIFYTVAQFVLAFHLIHGFQSAFQTLGLNHKKYTPFIKFLGWAFGILIPAAFAVMPVYFFLVK